MSENELEFDILGGYKKINFDTGNDENHLMAVFIYGGRGIPIMSRAFGGAAHNEMTEEEGFEPSRRYQRQHDFQSCAISRTRRLLQKAPYYRLAPAKTQNNMPSQPTARRAENCRWTGIIMREAVFFVKRSIQDAA